jgi:methionyl-tRNA formyltransferase
MVTADRPLRIVFFGTPDFAVPSLQHLLASRHQVVGVVTQPDRASGRGHKPKPGAIKTVTQAEGVPIFQPERLRDPGFLVDFRDLTPDLGVVAAYGKILTDEVLAVPRLGMVNVHASLLPKYRGAAPVHRAVIAGERETGVTIMRVVKALDAGPMLAKAVRPISPSETSVDVEHALAQIGASALVEVVDALAAGPVPETAQDEAQATYARKVEKADSHVEWSKSALDIHNQVRGLYPWPHASSHLDGERIILLESAVEDRMVPERKPGTVLRADKEGISVQTGLGVLRLTKLQREGRRPITAAEFLAGHRLEPGTRFVDIPPP